MRTVFALAMLVALAAPLALGLRPATAGAQIAAAARPSREIVRPGAPIRVTATALGLRRVSGTLGAVRVDRLLLHRRGRPDLWLPMSAINELQVAIGRDYGWGTFTGLLIGAGVGLAAGVPCIARKTCDALVVQLLAVGLAANGALVGALAAPHEWVTVPAPTGPRAPED